MVSLHLVRPSLSAEAVSLPLYVYTQAVTTKAVSLRTSPSIRLSTILNPILATVGSGFIY